MSVGVMKDYKLKQRNLRASHTLNRSPGEQSFFFQNLRNAWCFGYLRAESGAICFIRLASSKLCFTCRAEPVLQGSGVLLRMLEI
jgi:hypothetical protein